jgi:hypothetical protein
MTAMLRAVAAYSGYEYRYEYETMITRRVLLAAAAACAQLALVESTYMAHMCIPSHHLCKKIKC